MSQDKKLNPRQARFVEEYLIDLNATQAAIRAGYSADSAHVNGPRLLANASVAAAIDVAKIERSEATKIDSEWVLREAVELYQRCMQEVRPALHPKTRRQLKTEEGGPVFAFNAAVAARALELIGKHVEVNAFRENVSVSGELSLIDRINAGRRRIGKVVDADYQEVDSPVKLSVTQQKHRS